MSYRAGTGESWIRSNISIGNGVYRSRDTGETWIHAGLDDTGRVPRIVIDPRTPDIVLVCALGTPMVSNSSEASSYRGRGKHMDESPVCR